MAQGKKPTFEQFLALFVLTVKELAPVADPAASWTLVGDENTRATILNNFKKKVEETFGSELVVERELIFLDRSLESVAVQLYHVFSTVFLMEKINAKIRVRMH